jgi:hypothetical protein
MGWHDGMMECLNECWNDNTNNIIPSFQHPFKHFIVLSIPTDATLEQTLDCWNAGTDAGMMEWTLEPWNEGMIFFLFDIVFVFVVVVVVVVVVVGKLCVLV